MVVIVIDSENINIQDSIVEARFLHKVQQLLATNRCVLIKVSTGLFHSTDCVCWAEK